MAESMVTIHPDNLLTVEKVIKVARLKQRVALSPESESKIIISRQYIEGKLSSNEIIYGVNTGFGALASVAIPANELTQLQKNIIRSHASGVGSPLNEETVRVMIFLLVCSLSRGFSGIRLETIKLLLGFLNHDITPLVPEKGSLGASGDLAPLSHIALCLIGEGEMYLNGTLLPTSQVLSAVGLQPIELKEKEGLALINGTHFMTAIGVLLLYDAKRLLKHADMAAALSGETMDGTNQHTNPLLHAVRPHDGQNKSAINIRKLLADSELLASHKHCGRVQDAYSIRCSPQVHGASIDVVNYFQKVIDVEINSVTDNPLIFSEDNLVISGGNFHGQPLALAADFLCIGLAEIANISERRTARLVDASLSNVLPAFLVAKSGVHSGFMIAQYTAAALVSENKVLAHPSSVDSITSSANQEDHVSMGAYAMRKCRTVLENVTNVLAIEFLCNNQALDFRRPLKSSAALEALHMAVREHIPFMDADRYLTPDILAMNSLIKSNNLIEIVESKVGELKI